MEDKQSLEYKLRKIQEELPEFFDILESIIDSLKRDEKIREK